jgi:hypothetical protein
MFRSKYDDALLDSEMLRQQDMARALAEFQAGGPEGMPARQAAYDAATHAAEVAHVRRKLAAAVELNSGAGANDLLHQLRAWHEVG